MKNFFSKIKKLYIPIFFYFVISIVFVNFIVGFFEQYSKVDFEKVTEFVEKNKDGINEQINDEVVSTTIDHIKNFEKRIKESKRLKNHEEVKRLELELEEEKNEVIEKFGQKFKELMDNTLEFTERLEIINRKILEKKEKRENEFAQKKGEEIGNIKINIAEKQIDISKHFSGFRKHIKDIFDTTEIKIKRKYPIYNKLLSAKKYFIFFILFWMWPVYRYNFTKTPYSIKIEKRIMNLSYFTFWLIWVYGFYDFIIKILFLYMLKGTLWSGLTATYFVSFLMFSALASYFNLAMTEKYIKNKIALSVFKNNSLYLLKDGISFQITSRLTMFIISFSLLPCLILVYIPLYFNAGVIKNSISKANIDISTFFYIAFPFSMMIVVLLLFLLPQVLSIFWFRRSIQGPINRLIERMGMVSKGDFVSKASVLSNDEIGKLRGHFNEMVEGLQEREKIRDTFGKFVSLEIAEKLISQGSELLEGEEIETTVMFTDIRDFTPFSETMSPKELVDFLNSYFSYMCAPIIENKGVINKFIGDSIMAVFSPVFGVKDHAAAAMKAALGIREALTRFNKESKYSQISHGIGIHTGILISGKIGTADRMEYTVIGDTVNIASRVESQTKIYKDDILISESLYNKLNKSDFKNLNFHAYEPVLMKGKSKEMILYGIKEGGKWKGLK